MVKWTGEENYRDDRTSSFGKFVIEALKSFGASFHSLSVANQSERHQELAQYEKVMRPEDIDTIVGSVIIPDELPEIWPHRNL